MPHAGRRYQDKQYGHHENHRSDRYEEDRRAGKPYLYNARYVVMTLKKHITAGL